jgi:type IV pilus assembly protein PilE
MSAMPALPSIRAMKLKHAQQAFTLIEIMIVVAIIGILAAIAIPQYQEYVRSSRLTQATTALSEMRLKMEQYFQDNRSYNNVAAPPCGAAGSSVAPLPTATQFFTFDCPAGQLTATTYQVRALGASNMAGFTFTLTQAAGGGAPTRATPAVPAGWGWQTSTTCWVRNKSGQC